MTAPAIELRGVSKTFVQAGMSIEVLKEIDFQLFVGETAAILGESGSGKSTLLSLIAGLDQPTRGSVWIQGQDITGLPEKNLASFRARTLGIVFQQFHLMSNLTALENIMLPLEIAEDPHALDKGKDALNNVGLSARSTHFPSQLSGGERQRIAIARALVVQPQLLLADEPSGNLDTKTGREVMELLFTLVARHQTTLILVTHNEELAQRCRHRLHLVGGKLR